ncbi:hypothetical protein ACOSP7_019090 [Xanthoceras sorbifolium]
MIPKIHVAYNKANAPTISTSVSHRVMMLVIRLTPKSETIEMASLRVCAAAAARIPASQVVHHHRSFHLLKLAPSLRFKNTARLQIRQRLFTALASNSNPTGDRGDSVQDKSDETKTSDAPQGPPFLTILAGFLVFYLVCWFVGSTVMWLVGLIVK